MRCMFPILRRRISNRQGMEEDGLETGCYEEEQEVYTIHISKN